MRNKQRHGCLTAWLIYLIIAYSFSAILIFFKADYYNKITNNNNSENLNLTIGALAMFCIISSYMLFRWIKLGFWGILIVSLVLIIIRILNGSNISSSFFIILCLLILIGVLQLKKGNISGWDNLE